MVSTVSRERDTAQEALSGFAKGTASEKRVGLSPFLALHFRYGNKKTWILTIKFIG